jgi:hypothetical protein
LSLACLQNVALRLTVPASHRTPVLYPLLPTVLNPQPTFNRQAIHNVRICKSCCVKQLRCTVPLESTAFLTTPIQKPIKGNGA